MKNAACRIVLSPREFEILQLVGRGLSTREIGMRLDISLRTVEGHIEAARLKMRARNRVHMISLAIRNNILDVSEL